MFKITDSSPNNSDIDFVSVVTSHLPLVCAQLKELSDQDDGKLFGKSLSYMRKKDTVPHSIGWQYVATLGTPFTSNYWPNETRKILHHESKLNSNISIRIQRSQGELTYQEQQYDSIDMTILVVDNFMPAPKSISRFLRSGPGPVGSAQVHSRYIQDVSEEQACEILKHLKGLAGSFTAQSLFQELNDFAGLETKKIESFRI